MGADINGFVECRAAKSEVLKNQAGRDGGGINNEQEATADTTQLTLEDTKVSENRAVNLGSGIYNWEGAVVTLDDDSKITGNEPTNCDGDVPGCDSDEEAAPVKQDKG
ncbi:hypothetical protein [Streptomyces sp. NPDC000880]